MPHKANNVESSVAVFCAEKPSSMTCFKPWPINNTVEAATPKATNAHTSRHLYGSKNLSNEKSFFRLRLGTSAEVGVAAAAVGWSVPRRAAEGDDFEDLDVFTHVLYRRKRHFQDGGNAPPINHQPARCKMDRTTLPPRLNTARSCATFERILAIILPLSAPWPTAALPPQPRTLTARATGLWQWVPMIA
jgi:hypothetical protein